MANPILKNQNNQQIVQTDTILASGTVSGGIDLMSYGLVGLVTDANWTTSNVTFNVQIDGASGYVPVLEESGDAYTLTSVPASSYILIPNTDFPSVRGIQIVSVTTQTDLTNISLVAVNI